MPRTGRPKVELILSDEEREQLLRWSRRAKSSQALALRSRIVLGCGEGLDNTSVAGRVGCSTNTVGKWRARFLESRLDGLVDEPRPGRPVTITAEQVEDVVVATLESTPKKSLSSCLCKRASLGFLEVGLDAVGVGEGELREGLLPIRGDLALDEAAFGVAFDAS